MVKHLTIRVQGRVQGVWYRASTEQKARELGLTGFVQNENDGSVYIEAEGDSAALALLVDWCREGPFLARVEQVDVAEGEMRGFKKFEQKRS